MKKAVLLILFCAFLAMFCVSGYMIFQTLSAYRAGEAVYDDLKQYAPFRVAESEKPEDSGSEPAESIDASSDVSETPKVENAWFDALTAINPDVVGWIYLEGCGIDYPIVQGGDNDYYLSHLFNGDKNRSGSIFLDFRNDPAFSDRNSVIYGHHMNNGSMFAGIVKYGDQAFYDANPTFELFTPWASYTVNIFAGYAANVQDEAWKVRLDDDADFAQWIEERIRKSAFQSGITPSATDRIVTLSTCTNTSQDTRFILFGVISGDS